MTMWKPALVALAFCGPAMAQTDEYLFPSDCLQISGTIYMCDAANAWITLELPEDLLGVGFAFESGVDAEINVMESPYVGIQVRAQRYEQKTDADFIAEELTKIDGFPAITYIGHATRDGQEVIEARTELRLYQLSLSATTYQSGDIFTPAHADIHADMLAGITHEWSFD